MLITYVATRYVINVHFLLKLGVQLGWYVPELYVLS